MCENVLVINRETIQIIALEGAVSLMILQQRFKASNVCPVRFTHHKGFTEHLRATLIQKLSTDYFGKLTTVQCQTVNWCAKHDYLLWKRGMPVKPHSSLIF
jgi:hypothetical protein